MTVFRLRYWTNFSVILLLLFILDCRFAQKCAENPLTIKSSPGFLSGAIQHVGNQECTASGTCLKIPQLCPNSSCCVSTPNNIPTNISIPPSLSKSKCGCWDSRRKSCQPVPNFIMRYSSCDSQNGVQIQSKMEISQGSRKIISNVCKGSLAEVQFNFGNEGKGIYLEINLVACTQQSGRIGRGLTPDEDDDDPLTEVEGAIRTIIQNDVGLKRRDILKTFADYLGHRNYTSAHFPLISNQTDFQREKVSSKCAITTESDSFSMTSNFLSGTINNFLNRNTGMCWGQGSCKFSSPECQSTSCCLVSTSGDKNSSGDSCECLGSVLGIGGNVSNSCLVNHKVYKVFTSLCTGTGERVQRSLSVRIPSNGLNRCISDAKSWEKASLKFETNGNGNLAAIIEIRKCILSGANVDFLEIEEIVEAELNVDIVSKLVEQME